MSSAADHEWSQGNFRQHLRKKGTVKHPVEEIPITRTGVMEDAHAGEWHRPLRQAAGRAAVTHPHGSVHPERIACEGRMDLPVSDRRIHRMTGAVLTDGASPSL